MAVHLSRSDTLILLPVKVGGTWLRRALTAGGVSWVEKGPKRWRGHCGLETHHGAPYIATFVRGPVAWYHSYWAYRMEGGWRPRYELDRLCAADDFRFFVRNVVTELPGYLTAFFERYAGPAEDPVDFVGRQETLADDLVRLLRGRGETFDERRLRSTPRANMTRTMATIDPSVFDVIHVAEQRLAQRFGYEWSDPLGLGAMQLRYPEQEELLRRLVLWTERIHWRHDDPKRERGDPSVDIVRQARCFSNYALFAQYLGGDLDHAITCYQAALERAPSHPRTLANYAVLQADELNDAMAAESLFRRALESRPNHLHSLALYRKFLEQLGRSDEAETYATRLAALSGAESALRDEARQLFGTV